MNASDGNAAPTYGHLTVVELSEQVFIGGYLILNSLGRPLEFHCTLPVKPTRAQVLLYGTTIHDFVCGEQIALALVNKAKLKPQLLLTDCPATLALNLVAKENLLLLTREGRSTADDSKSSQQLELLHTPTTALPLKSYGMHGLSLASLARASIDESGVESLLASLCHNFDLSEPFDRIVDAILEAHPLMRAA